MRVLRAKGANEMVFNDEKMSYRNGDSSTVGVLDWLLFDAIGILSIIPIVGPIAAIVLYVVIGSFRDSSPSVQNRIIVNFIWLGVWLVALLVLAILGMAGVFDPNSTLALFHLAYVA